jgi:acyl-coenzyme A thioesterase PaaI-like protein
MQRWDIAQPAACKHPPQCQVLVMTTNLPVADIPEGFLPLFRTSPFLDTLGPFFYRPTASSFVIGLRIASKHANARGSAHGGLIFTLADIALGYTASASSGITARVDDNKHRR